MSTSDPFPIDELADEANDERSAWIDWKGGPDELLGGLLAAFPGEMAGVELHLEGWRERFGGVGPELLFAPLGQLLSSRGLALFQLEADADAYRLYLVTADRADEFAAATAAAGIHAERMLQTSAGAPVTMPRALPVPTAPSITTVSGGAAGTVRGVRINVEVERVLQAQAAAYIESLAARARSTIAPRESFWLASSLAHFRQEDDGSRTLVVLDPARLELPRSEDDAWTRDASAAIRAWHEQGTLMHFIGDSTYFPTASFDTVEVLDGAADADDLILRRAASTGPRSSGWTVAAAAGIGAGRASTPLLVELLARWPWILSVMALPVGTTVRVDAGRITSIEDAGGIVRWNVAARDAAALAAGLVRRDVVVTGQRFEGFAAPDLVPQLDALLRSVGAFSPSLRRGGARMTRDATEYILERTADALRVRRVEIPGDDRSAQVHLDDLSAGLRLSDAQQRVQARAGGSAGWPSSRSDRAVMHRDVVAGSLIISHRVADLGWVFKPWGVDVTGVTVESGMLQGVTVNEAVQRAPELEQLLSLGFGYAALTCGPEILSITDPGGTKVWEAAPDVLAAAMAGIASHTDPADR